MGTSTAADRDTVADTRPRPLEEIAMTPSTPTDIVNIEVPYPASVDLSLQIHVGPCRIRFAPTDGPSFITGTYSDPTRNLPVEVRTNGGVVTISQRVEFLALAGFELPRLDLTISRTHPFALEIQTGATETTFDLGGLPLTRLALKAGAARFETDFSLPNPTPMTLLDIGMGAGALVARHLANANFGELRLGGGMSASTLDFSGTLQRDAHGRIDAGLASVDVLVPASTSARIVTKAFAAAKSVAGLTAKGDAYYTAPALEGKHPLLELEVSMAFGSLALSTT
jgi:hypothetical protein